MTTASSTLQVGIIGCGRIAQPHLRHLLTMQEAEITAVCDTDETRALAARRAVGDDRVPVYTDPLKMLADVELDAVYVLTPTPTHADLGCAVLEHGHHLFIEKPLASSRTEGQRLEMASEAAGRITCVGHQWRYLRGASEAKEQLAGLPIALVHAWYYWTWPLVEWIADKKTGGGQMLDQGIHLVDLARYVAGEISDVRADYALVARRADKFPNWDAQSLLGRFENGGLLSIAATYALFKETSELPTVDFITKDLQVRVTPRATEVMRPGRTTTLYEKGDPMEALDRAFVMACVTGDWSLVRSPIADANASLDVVMRASEDASREERAG